LGRDRASAIIGADFIKGDEDAMTAFFVQLGRQKLDALAGYIVHGNIPKAREPEPGTASGGHVGTLNILAIPSGQYFDSDSGWLLDADGHRVRPRINWVNMIIVPEGMPLAELTPDEPTPVLDNVVELHPPVTDGASVFVDEAGRAIDLEAMAKAEAAAKKTEDGGTPPVA
jgi:hypothetical protein